MGKRQKNFPAPPLAGTCTAAVVAQELGVAVAYVEGLLGEICVAGEDFTDEMGLTLFTPAGVKKIRDAVEDQMRLEDEERRELGIVDAGEAQESAVPAAGSPRREDLTLTRVFRWSTNVMAQRANGLEVVLRVKTIAHLQAGMVLKACIEGMFGWTYEGRLPRTIGERQHYFPCTHK